MSPVLGRIVVEGEQGLFVVGDLLDRLGPLGPELSLKLLDGLLRFGLVLRLRYLLYGLLGPPMHAFGQRVKCVGGFVNPVALVVGLWEDIPYRIPETQCPVSHR